MATFKVLTLARVLAEPSGDVDLSLVNGMLRAADMQVICPTCRQAIPADAIVDVVWEREPATVPWERASQHHYVEYEPGPVERLTIWHAGHQPSRLT